MTTPGNFGKSRSIVVSTATFLLLYFTLLNVNTFKDSFAGRNMKFFIKKKIILRRKNIVCYTINELSVSLAGLYGNL